jgi:hypothetical protein
MCNSCGAASLTEKASARFACKDLRDATTPADAGVEVAAAATRRQPSPNRRTPIRRHLRTSSAWRDSSPTYLMVGIQHGNPIGVPLYGCERCGWTTTAFRVDAVREHQADCPGCAGAIRLVFHVRTPPLQRRTAAFTVVSDTPYLSASAATAIPARLSAAICASRSICSRAVATTTWSRR